MWLRPCCSCIRIFVLTHTTERCWSRIVHGCMDRCRLGTEQSRFWNRSVQIGSGSVQIEQMDRSRLSMDRSSLCMEWSSLSMDRSKLLMARWLRMDQSVLRIDRSSDSLPLKPLRGGKVDTATHISQGSNTLCLAGKGHGTPITCGCGWVLSNPLGRAQRDVKFYHQNCIFCLFLVYIGGWGEWVRL